MGARYSFISDKQIKVSPSSLSQVGSSRDSALPFVALREIYSP